MKTGLELLGKGTKMSENQESSSFAFHFIISNSATNASVSHGAISSIADSTYTISNAGAVHEYITTNITIVPDFGISLNPHHSGGLCNSFMKVWR
jgi:hypothetical protein